MPAIHADTMVLPRITEPDPARQTAPSSRSPLHPPAWKARGSPCGARSPASTWRPLDPFVHMDQMGEVDYAPGEPKGTPWHPHRGSDDGRCP